MTIQVQNHTIPVRNWVRLVKNKNTRLHGYKNVKLDSFGKILLVKYDDLRRPNKSRLDDMNLLNKLFSVRDQEQQTKPDTQHGGLLYTPNISLTRLFL